MLSCGDLCGDHRWSCCSTERRVRRERRTTARRRLQLCRGPPACAGHRSLQPRSRAWRRRFDCQIAIECSLQPIRCVVRRSCYAPRLGYRLATQPIAMVPLQHSPHGDRGCDPILREISTASEVMKCDLATHLVISPDTRYRRLAGARKAGLILLRRDVHNSRMYRLTPLHSRPLSHTGCVQRPV